MKGGSTLDEPIFCLDNGGNLRCAKLATHIVVATEGDSIDGQLTVLESLKGDLKAGQHITIPELRAFNSPESRAIECLFPAQICPEDIQRENVTGTRMILFLRRDSQKWKGVGELSVYQSTIWIEGRKSFAYFNAGKGRRGRLADFEQAEEWIKVRIGIALED
jgi:hypothetical protein